MHHQSREQINDTRPWTPREVRSTQLSLRSRKNAVWLSGWGQLKPSWRLRSQKPGRGDEYKYRGSPTTSSPLLLAISTAAAFQPLTATKEASGSLWSHRPLRSPPKAKMRPTAFLLPALVAATPVAQVVDNDGWADAPDPRQIQISDASFSGSGCPQGTVSTSISPDKTVRGRRRRFSWHALSEAHRTETLIRRAGHHLWLRCLPDHDRTRHQAARPHQELPASPEPEGTKR